MLSRSLPGLAQFQGDVPNCTDLVLEWKIEVDGDWGLVTTPPPCYIPGYAQTLERTRRPSTRVYASCAHLILATGACACGRSQLRCVA